MVEGASEEKDSNWESFKIDDDMLKGSQKDQVPIKSPFKEDIEDPMDA